MLRSDHWKYRYITLPLEAYIALKG
ncbi:hypothetical protein IL54_4117 [Sphingobium sp. ba1]|nr:hypothetical protein IL54_4117 [Sphingobium sp. ba1]